MTTFTKNRQTGEFDIIGLADALAKGREVNVLKKNGQASKVVVGRCSRPFTAKFGPNQGKQVVIAKVQGFAGNGGGRRGGRRGGGETKQCWECGCEFTYGDARANNGDWQDSYCGC